MPLLHMQVLCSCGPGDVTPCATAGIGKSMMGYLLLYRCACQGRRVVVLKSAFIYRAPVLLCKEGAFKLDAASLEHELRNPDVMCVIFIPIRWPD